MATAPQKRPQVVRPPEGSDFADDEDLKPSPYKIFATENVTPPPQTRFGRQRGRDGFPFAALTKVGMWFLVPAFVGTEDEKRKARARLQSHVYKPSHRRYGLTFRLLEIDQRFADEIGHPELKGRLGVWRVSFIDKS